MFQYETIVDLADVKYVSFVCEKCAAVSIINVDVVTTTDGIPNPIKPACPRCRRDIPYAQGFIDTFRILRAGLAAHPGIRLRTGPKPLPEMSPEKPQ